MKVSANVKESQITILFKRQRLSLSAAEATELQEKITDLLGWIKPKASAAQHSRLQGSDLYAMRLHDEITLPGGLWVVTRVPGGWIYSRNEEQGPAIFVAKDRSWTCAADL